MRWWRASSWAAVLLLAASAVVQAQDAPPLDVRVQEEDAGQTVFESLRDFSSFGASVGFLKLFGGDLGADSKTRPVLQGVFRYRFSESWVGMGEFGFGWSAFEAKGDTVLTFNFGTLGTARRVAGFFGSDVRLGAGAGFYRWNYKYHGHSVRDDETFRFYRGIVPGGYLGLESEVRVTRHVTLVGLLQHHFVFTGDGDKFQSLFDQDHRFLSFRLGANYHFSPYQGILWERKGQQNIRLESGQEGK
jgi:hypothetical protein